MQPETVSTSGKAAKTKAGNDPTLSTHTPMVEEEQLLSGTERRNYLL
jgi:hypothetical protein